MRGSCASLPRSHSTAGSGVPPPGLVRGGVTRLAVPVGRSGGV